MFSIIYFLLTVYFCPWVSSYLYSLSWYLQRSVTK